MKRTKTALKIILGISVICIILAIVNIFSEYDIIDKFLNILELVGILLGVITFLYQQLSEQRSQNTEFFIELKNNFITNESLMATYYELYLAYTGKEAHISQCDIVKYLAYFDSVAIAYQNKLIDLEEISKTFSYYFFIAVNNPQVQNTELVCEGAYYPRIYELYDFLYKYEEAHDRKILLAESALHKTEHYKNIIKSYSNG